MSKITDYFKQRDAKSIILGLVVGALVVAIPVWVTGRSHDHSHDTEAEGKQVYTCSMHPQVKQDHEGKCPICGMDLIPMAKSHATDMHDAPNSVMMSE